MKSSANKLASAREIMHALALESHVEGGYFHRSYQADHRPPIDTEEGARPLMTSIYYMLTVESPIGHWHLNKSDIMHYFHLGDAIEYLLIHPDGHLEKVTMGSGVSRGEQLQLLVEGGIWKASRLLGGGQGFGLISEAVSPGFDYADMSIGKSAELMALFPQHATVISAYSKY